MQETYDGIPVMTREELDRAARGETCLCGAPVVGRCTYCKRYVCKDEYTQGYCIDCFCDIRNPLGSALADLNEDSYRAHLRREGAMPWNDHPEGCYWCGSINHHSGECRERG